MTGRLPPRYRVGETARLTALQLADYMSAAPARRRRIVQEIKFPHSAIGPRHDGAREAIVEFLCDAARPPDVLTRSIEALHARAGATVSAATRQDSLRSIAALEAFRAAQGKLGLAQIDVRAAQSPRAPLMFGATQVVAALDGVTRRRAERGTAHGGAGGLILMFADDGQSSENRMARCRIIAALAHAMIVRDGEARGEPDPQLSMAIDVFGGLSCVAGADWPAEGDRIIAAGNDIAAQWTCVEPPIEED